MEELVKIQTLRQKYASVQKVLHERGRRIWAATEAQQLGWGGISLVEKAIGIRLGKGTANWSHRLG